VLEALFCTSQRYLDEGLAWQTERPWFEPRYHQALRNLRKSSPKSFSQIYDSMQANAALLSATLKPSILDIAGDILGVRDFELATTSPMLRMDPPFDQRNSLDWHQERSYYHQNDNGDHGLVMWLPIMDAFEEHGAMRVRPNSHRKGWVKPLYDPQTDQLSSQQYVVPQAVLDSYPAHQIEVTRGTAVFFSFHLFHQSGLNQSDLIRLTMARRFHIATKADFHPNKVRSLLVER
jgi:ectoine hydroxylase-related dioxygenase (phytanoyl-CoA dioxygenase family)